MSRHAICCVCGSSVYDIYRGWVKHPSKRDDQRVWFLCADCLDSKVRLEWSKRGPKPYAERTAEGGSTAS